MIDKLYKVINFEWLEYKTQLTQTLLPVQYTNIYL